MTDMKKYQCPHFCGNCNLGLEEIEKCKSEEPTGSSCSYLIGLSDLPYNVEPDEDVDDDVKIVNTSENGKLNIEISLENPCFGCNGECCDCNKFGSSYSDDELNEIEDEVANFRLKLEINMRNRKEVTISI